MPCYSKLPIISIHYSEAIHHFDPNGECLFEAAHCILRLSLQNVLQ